jgi:hypothetical protein
MDNRDERHHVNPDSYRMNLHCCNCISSHMGVIVPPAYSNQEWICDHYNFTMSFKNKSFILRATPSTPNIIHVDNLWKLNYLPKYKFTELLLDYRSKPIVRIPFVSLSTNNDMHVHAKFIFEKLMKLAPFS